MSPTGFLLSEVQLLRKDGWAHEQAWIIKGDSGRATITSATNRGATVQLDRRINGVYTYTEIDIITKHDDLGELTSGDPRYPVRGKIAVALRAGAPVLDVLLGNGEVPKVT